MLLTFTRACLAGIYIIQMFIRTLFIERASPGTCILNMYFSSRHSPKTYTPELNVNLIQLILIGLNLYYWEPSNNQ